MKSKYAPSRKVIAAILLAVVGTVYLVASGEASYETITAVWAPVAAAYSVSD
jgi:dsRNA-specific ribonuclease